MNDSARVSGAVNERRRMFAERSVKLEAYTL